MVSTVLKNKLLAELGNREHKCFKDMKPDPLYKWNVNGTEEWISRKGPEKQTMADFALKLQRMTLNVFQTILSFNYSPHY